MIDPKIVVCKGCMGDTYACMKDIQQITDDGDVAFMIYSKHVSEMLEELGYYLKYQNLPNQDVPIGMWISKKPWEDQ